PLRPFLTTFEEQQKKHFFYHIINNMAQIYEYQDIDAHVILLFVHPACFHVLNLGDIWSKKRLLAPKLCLAVLFHNRNAACLRLKVYLCIDFR
ncbi:MAG: hypothetical protein SPC28_01640, partial [Alloprevotella sp.]|nr:hypothetical protein [Alloprevotella sp.]